MAKHSLSDSESAAVRFFEKAVELKERIYADEFGGYISAAIAGIDEAVAETLEVAYVSPNQVGTVLLTGGSSAVKQVQHHLKEAFPAAELRMDTEKFNSVSLGLAMEARRIGLATSA